MPFASRIPHIAHIARLAVAAAWLSALALQPATADPMAPRNGFPSQPVKFISPFPPGAIRPRVMVTVAPSKVTVLP